MNRFEVDRAGQIWRKRAICSPSLITQRSRAASICSICSNEYVVAPKSLVNLKGLKGSM